MSQMAIQLEGVSVTIKHTPILQSISAAIPVGAIVGLLGPSGAGKTTLMRAIVGLQQPTAGTVTVLGHKAGSRPLRSQIGYMTQGSSIYTDLTVYENLRYFAAISGVATKAITDRMEQLHLTPQRDVLAGSISGGQKTRVSLAAALLSNPPLLVLDEPTVGIDPLLRAEIWDSLRELSDTGTTLLVSSHVMDEATHCDRLLLLRDGRLLADETPQQIMLHTDTLSVEAAFLALIRGQL